MWPLMSPRPTCRRHLGMRRNAPLLKLSSGPIATGSESVRGCLPASRIARKQSGDPRRTPKRLRRWRRVVHAQSGQLALALSRPSASRRPTKSWPSRPSIRLLVGACPSSDRTSTRIHATECPAIRPARSPFAESTRVKGRDSPNINGVNDAAMRHPPLRQVARQTA